MLNQAMPLRGNGLDHAIIYDAMKILVDTLPRQQKAALEIEDFFDTLKSGFNGSTGSYGEVSLINLQTKERQFCRIRSSYEWMAFEGGELTQVRLLALSDTYHEKLYDWMQLCRLFFPQFIQFFS